MEGVWSCCFWPCCCGCILGFSNGGLVIFPKGTADGFDEKGGGEKGFFVIGSSVEVLILLIVFLASFFRQMAAASKVAALVEGEEKLLVSSTIPAKRLVAISASRFKPKP